MANPKSKRRSRKRRKPQSTPRVVASERRQRSGVGGVDGVRGAASAGRPDRSAGKARGGARGAPPTPFGPYGERPPSPFGGVPASEIAIFAGGIGFVVGLLSGGGPALIVGAIVCGLGVLEVTAREHFSGYRSHSLLLAAYPTVAFETLVVVLFGVPSQRLLLLVAIVPVFAGVFWLLRKRFLVARQARVARLG